jgi:hypothetical protein
MRSSLLVLIPLFVACGASIDPAMRADVDRQVATLQPRATTYPAPTSTEPMPLAPGQWVKLKLVDKQSRPSFMTYKVVGQEGDAHWIEVKTEQYSGKTVLKMLLALGDRTDVNKVEIRRLIVKQGDRAPMDYQSPMLDIVKGTYKSVARGLVVDWKSLPRETKTAPAGTFEDSFTGQSEVSLFGFSSRAKSWSHPAVPIQGLVHSDGEDGSKIDVVDFGTSGATSEL